MFQGVGRIFPCHIIAVGLSDNTGTSRLATIGDERLIDFVDFVVLFAGGKFVGHLLEDSVALGIHAKGIIIDGLGIEQIVCRLVIRGSNSMPLQQFELFLSTFNTTHLDVHLKTLFGSEIVAGSALARRKFGSSDRLIGTA